MQDTLISFPKYCNHPTSNWIIWIIFFIFLLILIIELIWSKGISRFLRKNLNGIYKKPILTISVSVLVLITLSYLFERNGTGLFVNSNILSILSVVGILGTIIGVILTYEQLKIAEDRIDGYEKLYSELRQLMGNKNIKKFQFYGSTIIPGQIAYGDVHDITEYKTSIYSLVERLKDNFEIIVPSDTLYIEAYSYYSGKTVNNKNYSSSDITNLLKTISSLQKTIADNGGVLIYEKSKVEIIDNFYFSNGITAIYVVPLHFQVAIAGSETITSGTVPPIPHDKNNVMHPELIGFKTTNRSIIKAFEQNFNKLKDKINAEP